MRLSWRLSVLLLAFAASCCGAEAVVNLDDVNSNVNYGNRADRFLHMFLCRDGGFEQCIAFPHDRGCTQIVPSHVWVRSMGEPRYTQSTFRGCTVYRRSVVDCSEDNPGSYKRVRDFKVKSENQSVAAEYAVDGQVPHIEPGWEGDIGSFKCED